jgi:hypothetical protein
VTAKKILAMFILVPCSIVAYTVKSLAIPAQAQSSLGTQSTNPTPATEKTAGEVLKNIQVLKDVPISNLTPTMQFMSGSLGVSCEFCHQVGSFERDVKQTKQTARLMIKMTRSINEANFGGSQKVTCNTCHQGNIHPVGVPHTWAKTLEEAAEYRKELDAVTPPDTVSANALTAARPEPAPAESHAPLPDVNKVLEDYRHAVGTVPLHSAHMVGIKLVEYTGVTSSLELFSVYPDKFFALTTVAGQASQQIMNGDHGWLLTAQGRNDLTPGQLKGTRDTMALFDAVKISDSAVPRKVLGIEKIGGRSSYVVESRLPKQTEKLYFDTVTGLLYKTRTESQTALGVMVTEILYEDYRDSGGVRVPYSISRLFMEDKFVYKFSKIETNVTVDSAKFEPPAAPTPPAHR